MRKSELIAIGGMAALALAAVLVGQHAASSIEANIVEETRERLEVIGFAEVLVEVDGRVVEVSGRVRTESDRTLAANTLRNVPGVARVIDNLVVIAPLAELRPSFLQVQKDDEALTLTGEAPDAATREMLEARASMAAGGVEFLNLMKARDRIPSEIWLTSAEAAIDAVAALRVGQASVEGGAVRVVGAALDADSRRAVVAALKARLDPSVALELDITAPPPLLSPYRFHVVNAAGRLQVKECAAPDAALRAVIFGALRGLETSEGASPEAGTECAIAHGAPNQDWAAAAVRAIEGVAALPEAEIEIEDDEVRVFGFVGDREALEEARRAAAAHWPRDYAVTVDIREVLPVVSPFTLSVERRPGATQVSGYAPGREMAARWAERLEADNALALARGAPAGWTEAAEIAIEALAGHKLGSLEILDRTVRLTAPGAETRLRELQLSLQARMPAGYRIEVSAAKAPAFMAQTDGGADAFAAIEDGAYVFVARRGADRAVEIRGVVGDAASKLTITAYARAKLSRASLSIDLLEGEGAPPIGWQGALFAAVEALSALERGEVRAEAGALYLTGDVSSGAALRGALALYGKAPAEFVRFSRVRVVEAAAADVFDPAEQLTGEECVARLNRVVIEDPIVFEVGEPTVQTQSSDQIDALAGLFARCPGAVVEVGGHTDSEGPTEINLALSGQRAEAVRLALITLGVSRSRILAAGYGEARPIADNETEEGRARNRRIEFKLMEE